MKKNIVVKQMPNFYFKSIFSPYLTELNFEKKIVCYSLKTKKNMFIGLGGTYLKRSIIAASKQDSTNMQIT